MAPVNYAAEKRIWPLWNLTCLGYQIQARVMHGSITMTDDKSHNDRLAFAGATPGSDTRVQQPDLTSHSTISLRPTNEYSGTYSHALGSLD